MTKVIVRTNMSQLRGGHKTDRYAVSVKDSKPARYYYSVSYKSVERLAGLKHDRSIDVDIWLYR